jgi:hypothetical protein
MFGCRAEAFLGRGLFLMGCHIGCGMLGFLRILWGSLLGN